MFVWKLGENPNGLDGELKFYADEAMTQEVEVEKILSVACDHTGVVAAVPGGFETGRVLDVTVPDFAAITDLDVATVTVIVDARFGDDVKEVICTGSIQFLDPALHPEATTSTLAFKAKAA